MEDGGGSISSNQMNTTTNQVKQVVFTRWGSHLE